MSFRCAIVKASALALSLLLLAPTVSFALAPLPEEQEIHDLANDILRKEIDLERYYLQYRVYGSKEPKSRRLRYSFLQSAGAAVSMASSIQQVKQYGRNMHHPELVNDHEISRSYRVGLVGIFLDGGSSAIELASNGWIAIKNVMQKKNPASAVREVVGRVKEIDSMCARREALVDKYPDSDLHRVYKAEGRVLRSFRDWCLSEFADVYTDVKSLQSSYNIYYVLDIASDVMYAISYYLSLKSNRDDRATNPANTTGLVGDSIGIASAPASGRGYYVLSKFYRKRLQKQLKESLKDSESDAKDAMADLQKELASKDVNTLEGATSVVNRTSAYALWSARYDKYLDDSLDDLRHANKVALQGEISGPIISGTYLAQDIEAVAAQRHFQDKPKGYNNLLLAGSIGATAGGASSLLLTNYWLIDDYRHRWKLKKKGELPEQLLAKRMKTLDELDSMLGGTTKSQPLK